MYKNIYENVMNKELALDIKEWKKNSSWRYISYLVSEHYPELNVIPHNQMEGIELCTAAMKFLNEEWE